MKQENKNREIINIDNWKEYETHISYLFYWIYQRNITSSFLNEEVSFECIAENTKEGNDIKQFDFEHIMQIAENIDIYIEKAIEGIKSELQQNPDTFGIKEEQIADYLNKPNKEFPVEMPKVISYPNKEMNLIFQNAGFPYADEGILVEFNKNGAIVSVLVVESNENNIIDEDLV